MPELASRQHVRDICGVVEARARRRRRVDWRDLGAIAVTQGPGLVGSLLVGVSFAKAVAWARGIPLVPVHHLAGHIESLVARSTASCRCRPSSSSCRAATPASTSSPSPAAIGSIGRTRDDAAGEAYDKVAKLLGLGYPGGPVDRPARARRARRSRVRLPGRAADPRRSQRAARRPRDGPAAAATSRAASIQLQRPEDRGAAARARAQRDRRHGRARADDAGAAAGTEVADICASFQRVVVEALLDRTFEAARWLGARSVGIAGGVSANSRLRADAEARGARAGMPVFVPPLVALDRQRRDDRRRRPAPARSAA